MNIKLNIDGFATLISFNKKNNGFMFLLVLLFGFQFLFLPFVHYHPDSNHSHHAELTPHQHRGHFHSHELETLTHFIHHEYSLNEEHHHSDSDNEHHHSDAFDDTKSFTLHKPQLVKASSVNKNVSAISYLTLTNSELSSQFNFEILSKFTSSPPKSFIARSPPAFLI